jgi:hypothetical protein
VSLDCVHGRYVFLWLDEFQAKKNSEKMVYENRPILGISAHGTEGPKMWEQHPEPLVLTIQRLAGRIPTAIRFDPIPSKKGRFSIRFDPLPHISSSPQESGIGFEVIEVGAPQLSARDWEQTRPYKKKLLGMFLDDSPMELIELDYIFAVHFLDGADPWFDRCAISLFACTSGVSQKRPLRVTSKPATLRG